MRQLSELPCAQEVAQHLRAQEAFERLLREHQMRPEELLWYAPLFEVRYKSIAATLRKLAVSQVLELASGVALRGLAMTRDPSVTYVESDLQELTDAKVSLVATLCRRYDLAIHGH